MSILHLVVLALVQGITEFLPISSSGHLVLIPALTPWPDQGLSIDIAVHIGTVLAVLVYFRSDVIAVIGGIVDLGRGRWTPAARLAAWLAIATVPVIIAGFVFKSVFPGGLRNVELIAWATIGFGVLLWVADQFGRMDRSIASMTWRDAMVIGLLQVIALFPGTSRSGITMTGARGLGFERTEAARFSLLLSIPANGGAGVLLVGDLIASGDTALTYDVAIGAVLAFFSALLAIWAMIAWLRRATFTPFVVYRLILGVVLLGLLYSGTLICDGTSCQLATAPV